MKIKLLFCLLLIVQAFSVRSQQFNWATSVSGASYNYGVKAIKDANGNTYFIGYGTGSSIQYNGVTYPANGDGDVFFAKLDSNKQLVWMKSIGANDQIYYDSATDIHIDPFGDIYLTCIAAGDNFTYDGQILSGIGSPGQYAGEAVLLKVNANGNYIWHDSGSVASSFASITTDPNGNVYITGNFDHSITLGSSITLTNPSPDTVMDMLVAKYQPNGTILWAKNAGGMPHNTFAYGFDIGINPQTNELIVLGTADGAVVFDGIPMPLYQNSNKGIVLISYTSDGTQNWVKRILDYPNSSFSFGSSMDISSAGIIGICGQTYNSGLVGFYTSDGMAISQSLYPTFNQLRLHGIVFNEFNEAYISGYCNTGGTLGISPGTFSINSTTGFIAKIDILQQVKWVEQFYTSSAATDITYANGKLSYASRIDATFTYGSGQTIGIDNYGDALFGEVSDYQLPVNRCNITGSVFQDIDADCVLGANDFAQNSVIVKAVGQNGLTHFSVSNSNGQYDIPVNIGTYTVKILPNPAQSGLIGQNCLTEQQVTLSTIGQDVSNVDFPIELANCPLLTVDIASDRRRRCFESNTYVSYANQGFSQAANAQVKVRLPEYVNFISSDHPYIIDGQGNYTFDVGTLQPDASGVIHIVDITQCEDGITGLTQCTEAWITPANDCADDLDPDSDIWDRSKIQVQGVCQNESSVQFTITNSAPAGIGDMFTARQYRIFADNALAVSDTFQLIGGESLVINYAANGQTIRIEADQHPANPTTAIAQATIEACGTNGSGGVSTGFVNTMSMGDEDVIKEVHCLPIIDSFDPNDKAVSPVGITDNHYVKAGTVLEYMIRFQNTGTDTAYKVVIKDLLPTFLDPATIQFGISSHPYTLNINGTGTPVLEFTFDNINLPHSAVDEPGSNGFVKFKAATYTTLENGIQVNNNADIYFDYNFPIRTNTVQNIISDFVLIQDPLQVSPVSADAIMVYPNPTSGLIIIEATDLQQVDVYDVRGMLLKSTGKSQIDLSPYASGIYFVKIVTHKGSTVKKIVLK